MLNDIAYAQTVGDAGGGGALAQFLPLILIVVLFYFLLIRPQQKRSKEHRQMLAALSVNDEVMTNGGIFGKVVKIGDNVVVLDLGHGEVRFQKQSVQTLLPQGRWINCESRLKTKHTHTEWFFAKSFSLSR